MAIKITHELPPITMHVDPKTGLMLPGDHRKDCCKNTANLEYFNFTPDESCYRCKVCGCRHFDSNLDKGKYGWRT
jgi:hypothetical protein